MSHARRLMAATVLAVATLAARPVHARVLKHVVEKGDTVELLAAEYYGDRELAIFIVAANGWTVPPKDLTPGSTIDIPVSYRVIVQPGDTLASIAKAQIDDARRGAYLGALNGLPAGREPDIGTELLIPYDLQYKAQGGDSLSTVAALYYGDSQKADLLAQYNFRAPDGSLAKGDLIDVPITDLEVRPTKMGPTSQSLAEEEAEEDLRARETRVAAGLEDARKAFSAGDYIATADQLFTLIGEGPSDDQLSDIHQLLAFDYVALGVPDLAVRHFTEVLARHPDLTLDPATVSPKIRTALDEARQLIANH
jgi:hypothetical protein